MLKELTVHLLGGIITLAAREFILLLPESIRLRAYIALSILMVAYYILAGAYLKNESIIKTIAFMQTLTYIGHLTYIFGKYIYRYSSFLGGGSAVWNATLFQVLPKNTLSSSFAFASVFFVFPFLICIGRVVIGKKLALNIRKNGLLLLTTLLFNALLNIIYPIAVNIADKSSVTIFPVGIAVTIMLLLCIMFGMFFKKVSWSKIYFIMLNIAFIGNVFSLCFPKRLIIAFSGSNLLLEKFFELLFNTDIKVTVMFFIPPLFILLGSFIGRKLIKDKTKKSDYSEL